VEVVQDKQVLVVALVQVVLVVAKQVILQALELWEPAIIMLLSPEAE
jgi:hypothetical protein